MYELLTPLLVICKYFFFHSIGCLFILLMDSFAVQRLLSLIRYHLFICAFIYFALGQKNNATIYVRTNQEVYS